ncbi:MAG: hypothetical protein C6P37_07175 [Caldibacillus debilis]|uniref:Uncharacterized protein n=1 Tax=Caldibacillus debilis TaxID=301148 RepID=A0A3E0K562_9BACI|nr:MAG: hypothetical protein C6P37_07175 [Caldibacillus debilis]REJ30962.1 MAG: hypothetical protein C6W56_01175 [Caldibacillus debilis]
MIPDEAIRARLLPAGKIRTANVSGLSPSLFVREVWKKWQSLSRRSKRARMPLRKPNTTTLPSGLGQKISLHFSARVFILFMFTF